MLRLNSLALFLSARVGAANATNILQVLAKFGTDGHMWIPGVGTVSGITSGNWSNTGGTVPATVGGTVARVDDYAGTQTATQATTASQPVLRDTQYRWEFDGVNDSLPLAYNPFKMADDFCVVAGASFAAAGAAKTVYGQSNNSNHVLPDFGFNASGQLGISAVAGALNMSAYGGSSNAGVGPVTAAVRNVGGAVVVRRNGVQLATGTVPAIVSLPLAAAIGAFPALTASNYFAGSIYPVIVIKGTVSDNDLAVVEAFVTAWTASKSFRVTLSNITGATPASISALVTINRVASGGGTFTPVVSVSRSSGKQLLSVQFDASGTGAAFSTNAEHDCSFEWDFGDEAGEYFPYGTKLGQSKNKAYGPQVAHVFKSAGTFTWTLTVRDPNGNTGTTTGTVTVAAWTDAEAIYLDTAATPAPGADSVPAGVSAGNCHQVSTWAQVLGYMASGKRVRIRKGTTFASSADGTVGALVGAQLDTYGATGAKPVLTFTPGSTPYLSAISLNSSCSDVRIAGIKIIGGTPDAPDSNGIFTHTANNVLMHDVEMTGAIEGIETFANSGMCLSECYVHDIGATNVSNGSPSNNGSYYYGAYLDECTQFAMIGSAFVNIVTGHGVRLPGIDRGVISNNLLSGARHGYGGGSGHVLTVRGFSAAILANFSGKYTEKVVIRDNVFQAPDSCLSMLQLATQNDLDASRLRNIIVENNYFYGSGSTPAMLTQVMERLTVRNNIADVLDATFACQIQSFSDVGAPAPSDSKWYNNTIYRRSAGSANGFKAFNLTTEPGATANVSGVVLKNNLVYAPLDSSPLVFSSTGDGYVESNNGTSTQQNTVKPWAAATPTSPAQYTPQAGNYAIDGGTSVPIVRDFFDALITGTRDIGAIQV